MSEAPITTSWTTFPTRGGTMDAYVATPPAGKGPGLLLLQEIFGVNEHIRAVAEQAKSIGARSDGLRDANETASPAASQLVAPIDAHGVRVEPTFVEGNDVARTILHRARMALRACMQRDWIETRARA